MIFVLLLILVGAIHALDWYQTLRIAAQPTRYYETNIVLGEHPSKWQVSVYFASTAVIGAYVLMVWLEEPLASVIAAGVAIVTAPGVYNNYRLGIR